MIEIEKGIPIPNRKSDSTLASVRKRMEIGDSYFVETDSPVRALYSAYQWGRGNGMKFSGRQIDGGVRIWRVA